MEIVLDALKDTALVFPFILLIYILIEFLENGTTAEKTRKTLRGNLAPLFGSATGIIPQLANSTQNVGAAPAILPLIAVKLVLATAVG